MRKVLGSWRAGDEGARGKMHGKWRAVGGSVLCCSKRCSDAVLDVAQEGNSQPDGPLG